MRIEPARLDQVRKGRDGRMYHISADAGGVAEDLARIDPHLKVRFAEQGEYFAVYWESDDRRSTYLVLTAQELDQRIVKRIEQIHPEGRGHYDYAAELEKQNQRAEREKREQFKERAAEHAPELAFAMRKDLGYTTSRAFIPADVPPEAA